MKQWIYFNEPDKFNSWLEKQKKLAQQESTDKQDPYSHLKSVVPQKTEVTYHSPHKEKSSKTRTASTGEFSHSAAEKLRRNQKTLGNKGELLIYNLLCQDFGVENVTPRSEAFVALDIIKPGQAISGEYDISYFDRDGTEYFVEVKTGDGQSFIITPGELRFAQDHADRYKLFLVYNVDEEEPKYSELPTRFWENSRFRKNEIIERIEYEF